MSNGTIRIPWGMWELGDGNKPGRWHPNPLLSMTAEEQRAANIANGYPCDPQTPSLQPSPQASPVRFFVL